MKLIAAVDANWAIGREGDLLCHIPGDLKYFKEKTLDKVIVMGGNTLLSFPGSKPLPKRTNVVLTDVFTRDDCIVCPTIDELSKELKKYDSEEIFIVGGAMFYRTMIDYCSEAYVTKVDEIGGAQVFFPNLDEKSNWTEVDSSDPIIDNGHSIRFTKYVNNDVKEF